MMQAHTEYEYLATAALNGVGSDYLVVSEAHHNVCGAHFREVFDQVLHNWPYAQILCESSCELK